MNWQIGDTVVHQRDGICKITGTTEMTFGLSAPVKYYVLNPLYENASTLYIPVDKADTLLRRPVTREEIDELLSKLPENRPSWIKDEKQRQAMLAEAKKHGSFDLLLGLVSVFYEKRIERQNSGRKFHSADEQFLRDTEIKVNREFAHALDIRPDEVPAYINDHVPDTFAGR